MTIRAVYKKCLNCSCIYRWNPDVGLWKCPKCGSLRGFTIDKHKNELSFADNIELWKIARKTKKDQSKFIKN